MSAYLNSYYVFRRLQKGPGYAEHLVGRVSLSEVHVAGSLFKKRVVATNSNLHRVTCCSNPNWSMLCLMALHSVLWPVPGD